MTLSVPPSSKIEETIELDAAFGILRHNVVKFCLVKLYAGHSRRRCLGVSIRHLEKQLGKYSNLKKDHVTNVLSDIHRDIGS